MCAACSVSRAHFLRDLEGEVCPDDEDEAAEQRRFEAICARELLGELD